MLAGTPSPRVAVHWLEPSGIEPGATNFKKTKLQNIKAVDFECPNLRRVAHFRHICHFWPIWHIWTLQGKTSVTFLVPFRLFRRLGRKGNVHGGGGSRAGKGCWLAGWSPRGWRPLQHTQSLPPEFHFDTTKSETFPKPFSCETFPFLFVNTGIWWRWKTYCFSTSDTLWPTIQRGGRTLDQGFLSQVVPPHPRDGGALGTHCLR